MQGDFLVKDIPVPDFLLQVRQAMECYFGADARRIAHALQVTAYAEEMLAYIDADSTITLAAAYLHDIGIPEAERIYGSSAGHYQEKLGPPVARELLSGLGASAEMIETVCAIIGSHHTPGGVDSPEFRILWDADMLVNLEEVVAGKDPERIRTIIGKSMVTEPGYRLALTLYAS